MSAIEEKLFQNRYRVDEEKAHVRVKSEEVCRTCEEKSCTWACPAGCYQVGEDGGVTPAVDGCLECGTCRIICDDKKNLDWEYPTGGHGILYKFG